MKNTKFTQTLLDFANSKEHPLNIADLYDLREVLNRYTGTATKNDLINFYNFMLNNFIENKTLNDYSNIREQYKRNIWELENRIEEKAEEKAAKAIKEKEIEIEELKEAIEEKDENIEELEEDSKELKFYKDNLGDVMEALSEINFNNVLYDEYENLLKYIVNFGSPNKELLMAI